MATSSLYGNCNACGAPRSRVQVRSDSSPNKGDWFYSCPNSQVNELCKKSFEWEDKAKHPDKFPKKTGFGGGYAPRAASSGPTGAVAPGSQALTEATGQEILKKLDFIAAAVVPPGFVVPTSEPMAQ